MNCISAYQLIHIREGDNSTTLVIYIHYGCYSFDYSTSFELDENINDYTNPVSVTSIITELQ